MTAYAENVSITISGQKILSGISFEIGSGESALLTGKTGSGKTVLGIAMCGYLPMWAGDWSLEGVISLFGDKIVQGDYRSDTGIVFDEPYSQISGLKKTVVGELAFPLECKGVKPKEIETEVKRYAKLFNIEHILESSLNTLSGGEIQRVVIACALIGNPRFLFLDRFLTEIDSGFRQNLMNIVSGHVSENRGAFIAAEDPWLLPDFDFNHHISLGEEASPPDFDKLKNLFDSIPSPENKKPMLDISELCFSYPGGRKILDNINLTMSGGEILFVSGPNGAGKTTLAKILSSLLKPVSGRVSLDSRSYTELSADNIISMVGFALQNPELQFCRKTVREELLLSEKWGNSPVGLVETLGLGALMDSHPFMLTKAEKKRLGIALAYGAQKKLIILDEPTQYQDSDGFMMTVSAICRMASEGKAVVVISHDPRFAEALTGIRTISIELNL